MTVLALLADVGSPPAYRIISPIEGWLRAFLLTQFVEVAIVAFLVARIQRGFSPPLARRLAVAFAASLVTHPIVWFVFPRFGMAYVEMVWAAELFAWLTETGIYVLALRGLRFERALVLSLVANAASLGIGLVLRALTGWV